MIYLKFLVFIATFIPLAIIGTQTPLKNSEKIFLTDSALVEYEKFGQSYPPVHQLTILSGEQDFQKAMDHIAKDPDFLPTSVIQSEKSLSYFPYIEVENDEGDLERNQAAEESQLKDLIRELEKDHDAEYEFFGLTYLNYLLDIESQKIQTLYFPLLFGLLFVLSLVILRSLKNALALFLISLWQTMLSLSALNFLFGSMNLISSIIPLLIFILNFSLLWHLFLPFNELRDFKKVMKLKLRPILLMSFSTTAGLLSLAFSDFATIRFFGLTSAGLIVVTFTLSLLMFTTISPYLSHSKLNYFPLKIPHQGTLGISLVLIILSLLSFSAIPSLTDASEYLGKKFKADFDRKAQELGGLPLIEIAYPSKADLLTTLQYEQELAGKLETITGLKAQGLFHLLTKVNQNYIQDSTLPNNLSALTALYSKLPLAVQKSYPLAGGHLTLQGAAINSDHYQKLVTKIQTSDSSLQVNGLYYQLMQAQASLLSNLAKSLMMAFIFILLITASLFKSLKSFIQFLLINLFPLLCSFLWMPLLGMSFNLATLMSYSIGLGLVVDGTIHLFSAYDKNLTKLEMANYCLKPIAYSSFILVISFCVLAFSPFLPIQELGINLVGIILVGVFADLILLPAIKKIW